MGTDEDRGTQGCAWASQAGAVLSNPFTSELAWDCETPSLILLRKWPCACAVLRDFLEKYRVALGLQAGMCCEKASASPLASVFSITDPAFALRINPVFSIFLSVYILVIRG